MRASAVGPCHRRKTGAATEQTKPSRPAGDNNTDSDRTARSRYRFPTGLAWLVVLLLGAQAVVRIIVAVNVIAGGQTPVRV